MKPSIYLARPVPEEVEAYLTEHCTIRKWEADQPITGEQLIRELGDAEGLLTSGTKIDASLLDNAPRLRVVSNVSVGYDNFDLSAMKQRNVLGTNTPGVLNETVADLTFSLILSIARRIPELDRSVKTGGWKRGYDFELYGTDVHHATLGIIGMGGIGTAVARRAALGFNMKVLYHNRTRQREVEQQLGAEYCSLEHLMRNSDYVVVLVPLTPETVDLIGPKELSWMKRSSFLIHVSRGKVVNEQALTQALQERSIAGAALDVYEQEPVDPNHPLLQFPDVIAAPHIGSATQQTRTAMAMLAAENLVKALYGEIPPNLVKELRS